MKKRQRKEEVIQVMLQKFQIENNITATLKTHIALLANSSHACLIQLAARVAEATTMRGTK